MLQMSAAVGPSLADDHSVTICVIVTPPIRLQTSFVYDLLQS